MRPPTFARSLVICAATIVLLLFLEGALNVVMAQNPFGAPRPSGGELQVGGIVGWLLAKQSEFYREMSSTLRAAKSDGSAVWTLFAISFAYGIFTLPAPAMARR